MPRRSLRLALVADYGLRVQCRYLVLEQRENQARPLPIHLPRQPTARTSWAKREDKPATLAFFFDSVSSKNTGGPCLCLISELFLPSLITVERGAGAVTAGFA
ncbi:hypothetical protein LX36DRAFT_656541 [Colletotrichum falcatum]|nr:hypothetical protein LX36DRAFT_656541 [Colletotrichum falcatum]